MKTWHWIGMLGALACAFPLAAGEVPLAEAAIFFEENATDGDLGVQFFLDGRAWRKTRIRAPGGHTMLEIVVAGNAKKIGLTEVFSESAEPSFDRMSRREFLDLFPEGDYSFSGLTVGGRPMAGVATLTHHMPAPPRITSPAADEEVDADRPLTVVWKRVPDPDPPRSVIVAYQVIVENDEDAERLRVFHIDMAGTDTRVTVPPEFLQPGREYKVELLAVETSGNRTITEVPFATREQEASAGGEGRVRKGRNGGM